MPRILKIEDGKINFACKLDGCSHCCCGPFSGINKNLSNLEGRPFNEIVLTEEDYDRLMLHGRFDLVEEGHSEHLNKTYHRMILNEDGSCKAWVDGRCTINSIKPTLCEAFPFYIDMFSGLCAIMCEGFRDECITDMKECEPSLEAARKMYEFWTRFYRESDEHD